MIFNICLLLYDKIDKLVNCLSNYCILPLPVSKGPFIATQLNSTPVLKPDDATQLDVVLSCVAINGPLWILHQRSVSK